MGQSVNMGIDRKGRYAKRLSHDHLGGFVPDSRESLQVSQALRHLAPMLFQKDPRKLLDCLRLLRPETTGPNDGLNVRDRADS